MNRLDSFLAYAESHRLRVCLLAGVMVVGIVWFDWLLPDVSVGFLYLFPLLFSAAALKGPQIVALSLFCAYLRESFDPLQGGILIPFVLDPRRWAPGAGGRMLVVSIGFVMTGFFVSELNQRRRLLAQHLREREEDEQRVRVLIETSPLAILTLDPAGRIVLANQSARQLLAFEDGALQGQEVAPYLPLLDRMLHSHSGTNIRTNVECKGQRRNGDVFLAHVWLSTFRRSEGPGLAAVVWDASENLRDREGAGLDSMMATSRVLIGALSHEIRNLASAAASAHAALGDGAPSAAEVRGSEQYQALGALIRGLEKIASSGLRVASDREAVVADLDTVLDETRIVIEPALREAGIRVAWQVSAGLPLVQADHHSLLQVFVNLARNSQQALIGCASPEVGISAELEKDLVVVRVRDNGPGVAHPEDLFRPFQPGAHSFGLGLYISRAILRAHGGGLRHEPGAPGCCFAVELWPAEAPGQE
jgi:two-component system, LuxR family, sensor kinase FixL